MDKKKITNYLSTIADKMIEGKPIDLKNISKEAKEKSLIDEITRKSTIKKLLSENKLEEAKSFIVQNNMQNFVDSKGKTILMHALATNDFDFVHFLIENGSIITSNDIHYCISNNVTIDIIVCLINKLIFDNNQLIDECLKESITKLLANAISSNDLELASLIYVSKLYSDSYDVLNTCFEHDNLDFAKYILELGFDISKNANSYFNSALSKPSLDWLKLLFKYNITLDKDEVSEILAIAIRKKDNKLASILFDSKLYSKMYDVLNSCLKYDNIEFAKYILEQGFDVNFNAENYFCIALRKPSFEYLNLLFKYNIALDKSNGTKVLARAICEKNNNLAVLLFDNNIYEETHDIIIDCIAHDNIDFAEYIIEHGFNANSNSEYYFNIALKKESFDWLKLLFKYNIKLNPEQVSSILTNSIREDNYALATLIYDSGKYSQSHDVLHDCITHNNICFAQYILCGGFDVNFNAAHYLEASLWKTSTDFLKLLINYHIDLEEYGDATMNYAIKLEKVLAIEILSKAGVKIKKPSKKCANLIHNKQLMITIINLCDDEEEIKKIFDLALNDNILIAEYILKKHIAKISFKQRLKYLLKKIFK